LVPIPTGVDFMTGGNRKLKLWGWCLFTVPLMVQIVNILLAANAAPDVSERKFLGILFLWSQLLVFPQVFGIVLLMYSGWRAAGKR